MRPGSGPMVYVKFLPSEYVLCYRGGRLVAEGPGLSFFFLDLNSSQLCPRPGGQNPGRNSEAGG